MIRIERAGTTFAIRIERPEKKNALNIEMYARFNAALREADADDGIHAVVLLGVPGIFTAGNDIKDFIVNPPLGEDTEAFRFLEALTSLRKPLIAGVDGIAVGVGATMLLHCDLLVASTRATFSMPFVRLGLVPEAGSSLLLPALVGHTTAMEWLLLGDAIDAATAHKAGLVNRLVTPEALELTTLELAQRLGQLPLAALMGTKSLVREATQSRLREVMQREGKMFAERLMAPETIARFMAFGAKKTT